MTPEAFKEAVKEAKRFIEVAKRLKVFELSGSTLLESGKKAAAVKRASMDLTRALAEMRQSR